jgi:hypothetical protein
MRKQSYVKLQHIYDVPFLILRNYSHHCIERHDLRLSKKSYVYLTHLLYVESEPFPDTPGVYTIANDDCYDLCGSPRPVG